MSNPVELGSEIKPTTLPNIPEETEYASDISSSYGKSTLESSAEASSTSWCECLSAPFICIWNSIASCVSALFDALFCCCPKGEVDLKEVWKETEAHIKKRYLDAVKISQSKTVVYESATSSGFAGTCETQIEVVKEHCLDRAVALSRKGHQVLVLNMAYPPEDGKAHLDGCVTQEAEIMRRSALSAVNLPPIPPKGAVLTPNVPVFRHGPKEGYTFMHTPVNLDFVTVVPFKGPRLQAAENGQMRFVPQHEAIIRNKIRIQMETGYRSGNKTLVLGAFGCNFHFKNPAHAIANLYREVIQEAHV